MRSGESIIASSERKEQIELKPIGDEGEEIKEEASSRSSVRARERWARMKSTSWGKRITVGFFHPKEKNKPPNAQHSPPFNQYSDQPTSDSAQVPSPKENHDEL